MIAFKGRVALIERFPQFFDMDAPGWGLIDGGIFTGPGWDGIISDLLATLTAMGLPPEFRIIQVKQKLGELRVYHNNETGPHGAAVGAAIAAAVRRSLDTCETCGQDGSRVQEGRRYVISCASCHQRRSEQ